MNRFVKRSMGMRNKPHLRDSEQPLIALHKVLVTVRQIFSADPATKERAFFWHFGGAPFPSRRLHDLAGKY